MNQHEQKKLAKLVKEEKREEERVRRSFCRYAYRPLFFLCCCTEAVFFFPSKRCGCSHFIRFAVFAAVKGWVNE